MFIEVINRMSGLNTSINIFYYLINKMSFMMYRRCSTLNLLIVLIRGWCLVRIINYLFRFLLRILKEGTLHFTPKSEGLTSTETSVDCIGTTSFIVSFILRRDSLIFTLMDSSIVDVLVFRTL